MKPNKTTVLSLSAAVVILLSSCSDSEVKEVSAPADASSVSYTTTTGNLFENSTPDESAEEKLDEDGYNEQGILMGYDEAVGFDIEYLDFKQGLSYEYNGEEMAFDILLDASGQCSYTLALLCNDRLIPFSLNGDDYAISFDVDDNEYSEEAPTYTYKFHPYGKSGETVTIRPLLILDTKAASGNKYFDIPLPSRCYVSATDSGNVSVTLNADGAQSYEEISVNDDIIPLEEDIADCYEIVTRIDEEGNEVEVNPLEESTMIEVLNSDNTVARHSYLVAEKDGRVTFDFVVVGRPKEEYVLYCWTNAGFVPIFDGEYQTKVCLEEFNQEIRMTFDVSLEDYPDLSNVLLIGFDKTGNYYKNGVFSIFDQQTADEFNAWLKENVPESER